METPTIINGSLWLNKNKIKFLQKQKLKKL